jgi:hypothetical protein
MPSSVFSNFAPGLTFGYSAGSIASKLNETKSSPLPTNASQRSFVRSVPLL